MKEGEVGRRALNYSLLYFKSRYISRCLNGRSYSREKKEKRETRREGGKQYSLMGRRMREMSVLERVRNVSGPIAIFFSCRQVREKDDRVNERESETVRVYIRVCSSVAKELDIAMNAIGFSRTPFPTSNSDPFTALSFRRRLWRGLPVSNLKITFFPLAAPPRRKFQKAEECESRRGKRVFIIYESNVLHKGMKFSEIVFRVK